MDCRGREQGFIRKQALSMNQCHVQATTWRQASQNPALSSVQAGKSEEPISPTPALSDQLIQRNTAVMTVTEVRCSLMFVVLGVSLTLQI